MAQMLAEARISASFAANTAAVDRAHGDAASPCARPAVRHAELLPTYISALAGIWAILVDTGEQHHEEPLELRQRARFGAPRPRR